MVCIMVALMGLGAASSASPASSFLAPSRRVAWPLPRQSNGRTHHLAVGCKAVEQHPDEAATTQGRVVQPRRSLIKQAFLASLAANFRTSSSSFLAEKALADVAADSGVQIGIPVGQYLPPSPSQNGMVRFTPSKDSTPSIRGRVLNPFSYNLDLPPSWKAITVGVIQTGDFCQPKCDEPWTEVKFEGKGAGKAKVMMVPTFRLTNIEKPTIEQVGDPDEVIQKIGPFVTGDYYDAEDMPTETEVIKENGRTYYLYNIDSPGAVNGPHNVAMVTTIEGPTSKDRYHAIMVVGSATNSEWDGGKQDLLNVAKSFRLTS